MNFQNWWCSILVVNTPLNNPDEKVVATTVKGVRRLCDSAYEQGKKDAQNEKSLFQKIFG